MKIINRLRVGILLIGMYFLFYQCPYRASILNASTLPLATTAMQTRPTCLLEGEDLDAEIIQDIFDREEIPIDVHCVKKLKHGSHSTFEINDCLILRFVSEDNDVFPRENEKLFLNYIRSHISTSIPECIAVGKHYPFCLYKKIVGEVLDKHISSMTPEQIDCLGKDLALFLTQLHKIAISDELETLHESDHMLGASCACHNGMMRRVPDPLELNQALQDILKDPENQDLLALWDIVYRIYSPLCKKAECYIHNDLHETNILVDPKTKKLAGIIDFSDAVRGQPFREFRYFYSMHYPLFVAVNRAYANNNGVDENEMVCHSVIFRLYRDFTNLVKSSYYPEISSAEDKQSAAQLRKFMASDKYQELCNFCAMSFTH